jgi:hypothetical protein
MPSAAGTEATWDADTFIASILGDIQVDRIERFPPLPASTQYGVDRTALDSSERYMDRSVYWIDAGPSPTHIRGAVVQWFSFAFPRSPV